MSQTIDFAKMHGLGNDYIYINTIHQIISDPAQFARKWSARHTGIGSDGLVLIGNSKIADFSMRIFNADGSEAMMCGNASRCIGKYVYDKGLTDKKGITLETLSGVKHLTLHVHQGKVNEVTVDMGIPVLTNKEQVDTEDGTLQENIFDVRGQGCPGTFVSMGNPHLVLFVNRISSIPLEEVGPQLEHLSLFPQRINVEFAEVKPDGRIRMRVWERGSGVTQACGTGACATAVAAIVTGRTAPGMVAVDMDGGSLTIEWKGPGHTVYMTGPAVTVFEGEIKE